MNPPCSPLRSPESVLAPQLTRLRALHSKMPRVRTAQKTRHRLLLVDDYPILREGCARLLAHKSDLKVCGYADSAAGALEAIATLKPDLVIAEIALDGMKGFELLKKIKALYPILAVLVLSRNQETLFARR